jgi:NADH dehydrogenase
MNGNLVERPLVLVVGGGFGGLNVVQGLKHVPVRILLVDKRNHHLFQPLLYQVATASLSADNIASPIRKILRKQENVAVGLVELSEADLDKKIIMGSGGGGIHYDYLVIATGMEQAYFGRDEYKPFAPGLKDLNDAVEIRRRILLAFEEAEFELDEESRRGKLTFVVVGGGATGVELAGAIIETATKSIPKDFRFVDTRTARVILVEGGDHLLGGMPEEMGGQAQRDLEDMGVEIRLNSYVTEIDGEGVMIGDEKIPAENVLWAAGVQGTSFARSLGVEMDSAERIKTKPINPGPSGGFCDRGCGVCHRRENRSTGPWCGPGRHPDGKVSGGYHSG